MAIETNTSVMNIIKNQDAKNWASKIDSQTKSQRLSDINLEELGDIKSAKSFTELLAENLTKVNQMQNEANTAIQKLASGESKNIHETMLAVEKADIAFKTMNQIRGKLIDAYKEIMRMQV
jgi:flagellar hook-basal body complex protein FliE